MVSKDTPSAPWSSISDSSSRPTSFSVRPARSPPRSTRSVSAASAASHASRSSAISPASLTSRSASTVSGGADQLGGVTGGLAQCGEAVDGHDVAFKSESAHPILGGTPGQVRPARPLDDDLGVLGLLRGLGAIAPVGGEHRRFAVGAHQQRRIRTREAGQITHVDQVRYQHGVEFDIGQPLPQPVPALGNSHGRRRYSLRCGPMSKWFTARTGVRGADGDRPVTAGGDDQRVGDQGRIDQHRADRSLRGRGVQLGAQRRPGRRAGQP